MDDTGAAPALVGRVVVAARAAEGSGDRGGYEDLLRQAGGDGAGALAGGLGLLGSADAVERAVGCDLLGAASDRDEEVRAEAATALVGLAEGEADVPVLRALAAALGRTDDRRAVPVLVALAGHADAGVRERVAVALPGAATGDPDGPGVRALVTLTRDPDPEVRNWATFALGFQSEADGPAIRAALWERTGDEYPDAREEGIRGLARRRDPRAVPLLLELLADPEGAHVLTFHAAQVLAAPELLPVLEDYDPDGTGVAEALAACDPVRRERLHADAWELLCALDGLRPDFEAALSASRPEPGLALTLGSDPGSAQYDVGALLRRAGGDPARAARLVVADHPDSPGVRALIGLTRSPDPGVRDWATHQLAGEFQADTPAIRAAFWERTRDEYPDAREEGIRGLARRRDPRALPLLLELLADPARVHARVFGSAEIMALPELLPALRRYDPGIPRYAGAASAVASCDPVQRERLHADAWELLRALDGLRPDLAAALFTPRASWGPVLGLGAFDEPPGRSDPVLGPFAATYLVVELLTRAGGDLGRAAALVAAEHPPVGGTGNP
ncbi:HEAT repeat domain-containing protein [Kitasatospora sp. NBC_00458]|uniref:HEAT repeat domain-containing protein n=1 Tax=Kitasatospora sp. NBC_00458 TaxID=2903568 RepID=UPI002E16BA6F